LDKDRYVSYVDNYARASQLRLVYPTVPDYSAMKLHLPACTSFRWWRWFWRRWWPRRRGGGGGGGNRNSVFYQSIIKTQKALQANASSQLSELAGELPFRNSYPGKSLAEMEQIINDAFTEFEKEA